MILTVLLLNINNLILCNNIFLGLFFVHVTKSTPTQNRPKSKPEQYCRATTIGQRDECSDAQQSYFSALVDEQASKSRFYPNHTTFSYSVSSPSRAIASTTDIVYRQKLRSGSGSSQVHQASQLRGGDSTGCLTDGTEDEDVNTSCEMRYV